MIKEIKYHGITGTPSDYECPDGTLAGVMNLVPDGGQLKPVLPPTTLFKLEKGLRVSYIHETSKFKHYIIIKDSNNTVLWTKGNVDEIGSIVALKVFGATDEIYQINSVGNTMIAQCSSGIYYFLWKEEDVKYLYLGSRMPELPISFGLQGEMVKTEEFTVSFAGIHKDKLFDEFTDENKGKITLQVLAKVNKFIADHSLKKGKFIFPFLVRYAYRLYDQKLTMHSAPVLMICSTDIAPQALYKHIYGSGNYYDNAKMFICGMCHTLDYAVIVGDRINQLKMWSDIIKSVDIFVSKPIYTYDQSGECKGFEEMSSAVKSYCICKHTNSGLPATYPRRYQKWSFSQLYAATYNPGNFQYEESRLILPSRTEEQIKSDIRATNLFYFLRSIKIEDLKTERTKLEIDKDYLQSLVTGEVMTDDYDSHDEKIAKQSFSYNSRLNISGISKKLYNSYNAGAMFPFTDGLVLFDNSVQPTVIDGKDNCAVYFFIKQSGKDIVVQGESFLVGRNSPVLYLHYPNVNCYKAVILHYSSIPKTYVAPMEPHGALNSAFFFGGWGDLTETSVGIPSASTDQERTIDIPNKIYTSPVNNPFIFPVSGINTIGTGRILGLSTAAKALSEGQFGQFPLYAFTTEGVWAMEISADGGYRARQPITRDICINPESITQIDSAVLFATDRGIMLLSGSTSQCITDILNNEASFSPLSLPVGNKVIEKAGMSGTQMNYIPFSEFLKKCGMLYDYRHQRIIVYNPTCAYAYIFSLKDKAWGMMQSSIADGVNSYPEALAMSGGGELINLSEADKEKAGQGVNGVLFSRPFKLDTPDILKTVSTVIQRGYFRNGHVSQVLYGSRDLFNWSVVWSSQDKYLRGFSGTPYKYYRIAVICKLNKDECLCGCSVQYTPKLINQLR